MHFLKRSLPLCQVIYKYIVKMHHLYNSLAQLERIKYRHIITNINGYISNLANAFHFFHLKLILLLILKIHKNIAFQLLSLLKRNGTLYLNILYSRILKCQGWTKQALKIIKSGQFTFTFSKLYPLKKERNFFFEHT